MNTKEDFFDEISDNELDLFTTKTKSKICIDSNEEEVLVDFTWVSKVEECLPYLDNIIRNPRRFLIQEEDIVPVEKAKRTTPETVRHLSRNTNLIQNIDEEGFIQPSKVLNVNKEDTIDIYENRFIYTLLYNLNEFVDRQIEKYGDEGSYYKCERKTTYEGETKLRFENVKINLSIESYKKHEIPIPEEGQLSMQERMKQIKTVLNGFSTTQFIKSLRQVAFVRSPIRKTNIILKEQNFRKALELWEYIEQYKMLEPKITNKTDSITDNDAVKERYDFAYFIDHNSLKLLDKKEYERKSKLYNVAYIKNLIEDYLNEIGGSEKTFTKMLKEQFKVVYKSRKKREATVKKVFNSFIKDRETEFRKCELLLR